MSQSSFETHQQPSSSATPVTEDRGRNLRSILIGSILLMVLIPGLVYGYSNRWGFLALFWMGLLAFVILAFLVSRLMSKGGFAQARCPQCGSMLHFTHPERPRTIQCEACKAWSAGTESMALISPNHIAEEPVFEVDLPSQAIQWPTLADGSYRCSLCEEKATTMIQLQGIDVLGDLVGMISPISIERVQTMQVPSCGEHKDGLLLDATGDELTLCFRSYSYYRAFLQLNPQPGTES